MSVSAERYPLMRRILHWLSAVIILWALVSGFTLALTDVPESVHQWIAAFNVATTLVFFPFFVLRLTLALVQKKPSTPGLTALQQRVAGWGHQAIYAAVLLVLVSGVLMMERPMPVYGLATLQPLLEPSSVTYAFAIIHRISCAALALLVVGHIAAVVVHKRQGVTLLYKMV